MTIDPATNLFIATPAYGGQTHTAYNHSLLRLSNVLALGGIKHTPAFVPGDSLITRARNAMVASFMAGPYTHLFFIDGDIEFESESALRLLAATQHEDIEVAGGIYPKKGLPIEFNVNFPPGSDKHVNQHPATGYLEVQDAPTGFLMVRRSAIVKMMLAYPERRCKLRSSRPENEAPFEYLLFDCFIDGEDDRVGRVPLWSSSVFTNMEAALKILCARSTERNYLSEDWGFSRLWQRIGGKVWIDPQIKLAHHGQYRYYGDVKTILVAEKPEAIIPTPVTPCTDLQICPWVYGTNNLMYGTGADDAPLVAKQNGYITDAAQIEGWMSKPELDFLAGAARQVHSIAEIGCWKGRSTFVLLSNCDGPVYAVDHWLGSEDERNTSHKEAVTGDVFGQFLNNVGSFENLHIVKKSSIEAASGLPEQDVPDVDMVFIDGGHTYPEVLTDIRAWKHKAKFLICGHDIQFPGVAQAVQEELEGVVVIPGTTIWAKIIDDIKEAA